MNALDLATTAVDVHGANQSPLELSRLIDALPPAQPGDIAVEIGCDRGGMLWLLGQLGYRVIAVTLHTRADGVFSAHGADVIVGDSTDPATQDGLTSLLNGESPKLVMVDGGHDGATCRSDVQFALSLVSSGTVVVHDIAAAAYGQSPDVAGVWKVIRGGYDSSEIVANPGETPGYGILKVGESDAGTDAGQRQSSGTARATVRQPASGDLR